MTLALKLLNADQCYDGAANMPSQKKDAESYVLKESPKAIITHG